jgi:transposase
MKKQNKFSPEVRERAVRMVLEHCGEYPSLWATIESIAPKIGCVPQTLNEWVRKHEVEAGMGEGVTSAERERVKALEREVKEWCAHSHERPFAALLQTFPHCASIP